MTRQVVPGTIIDKYRLVQLVGSGAMGVVYEAVHVAIGKRVAIKLLHPAYADEPDVTARFLREASTVARIESDYIIQCFDVGESPEYGLYMILEYLEGEDLQRHLLRQAPVDPSMVVTIGHHVASGLAKAHAAGVIHRDLKPANVFLTTRRDDDTLRAKVLDFGIATLMHAESRAGHRITGPGISLGTPQYMSPEQVLGAPLDARSDVWSLAMVLYECLRGEAPFADRDHVDLMMAITRGEIPPLRHVAPWVPRALADVIHAGLVRDCEQRIPSAAALAQSLIEAHPAGQPVSGVPSAKTAWESGIESLGAETAALDEALRLPARLVK
jgi:serine/threonine-protein kinase